MESAEQDILNILVIDDDEAMRDLLTRWLLPRGHQVYAVGSAEEGLGLLPYATFQVALLDQHLPGMEGLFFGEFLRKNNPHMKIALITGSDDERLERIGQRSEITVIKKPFDVTEVFDLVSRFREEAGERQQQRLSREAPDWEAPLGSYFAELARTFEIPQVPKRIEERLLKTVRRSLTELRSVSRYNERDRVVAYAGLVTLGVLGVDLPKTRDGRTLFEEFDELMRVHGRRQEFGAAPVKPTDE